MTAARRLAAILAADCVKVRFSKPEHQSGTAARHPLPTLKFAEIKADRVETLFPTVLAIAIGNELLREVEAAIRFVKTCSMRWCWTGRVEARRRRLFRP